MVGSKSISAIGTEYPCLNDCLAEFGIHDNVTCKTDSRGDVSCSCSLENVDSELDQCLRATCGEVVYTHVWESCRHSPDALSSREGTSRPASETPTVSSEPLICSDDILPDRKSVRLSIRTTGFATMDLIPTSSSTPMQRPASSVTSATKIALESPSSNSSTSPKPNGLPVIIAISVVVPLVLITVVSLLVYHHRHHNRQLRPLEAEVELNLLERPLIPEIHRAIPPSSHQLTQREPVPNSTSRAMVPFSVPRTRIEEGLPLHRSLPTAPSSVRPRSSSPTTELGHRLLISDLHCATGPSSYQLTRRESVENPASRTMASFSVPRTRMEGGLQLHRNLPTPPSVHLHSSSPTKELDRNPSRTSSVMAVKSFQSSSTSIHVPESVRTVRRSRLHDGSRGHLEYLTQRLEDLKKSNERRGDELERLRVENEWLRTQQRPDSPLPPSYHGRDDYDTSS